MNQHGRVMRSTPQYYQRLGFLAFTPLLVAITARDNPRPAAYAPAPQPAQANLCTMLEQVDLIIVAEVNQITPYRATIGEQQVPAIWTQIDFWVQHKLWDPKQIVQKGKLRLDFLGGSIEQQAQIIGNRPSFSAGEQVILFIKSSHPTVPTVGGRQGVLRIKNNRVYDDGGRPILGASPKGLRIGHKPADPSRLPQSTSGNGAVKQQKQTVAIAADILLGQLKTVLAEECP